MKRLALLALVMTVLILVPFSVQDIFAAIDVTNTNLRLVITPGPTGNEVVHWDATIKNVLNPDREELRLDLSTDQNVIFYRVLIPAGGLATSDGSRYTLTADAQDQTGLEKFELLKQADGSWISSLRDTKVSIPDNNYETVCAQLSIGTDSGSQCSPMIQTGSTWQLAS